jgi:hypothetical protein
MIELPSCPWCDRRFQARQTGGRAQRFCRASCRRAFHAALRSWALDAIAKVALELRLVVSELFARIFQLHDDAKLPSELISTTSGTPDSPRRLPRMSRPRVLYPSAS